MHERFFESAVLLLMLLNPFFMSIYLLDLIEEMSWGIFSRILVRAGLISGAVFMLFGWVGDSVFTDLLHVRFASFLLFGGIAFLVIGVRFLLVGTQALRELRGDPEHIAGSVAMPFMVGPGTVSASVLAGSRLPLPWALLAIVTAVVVCVISVIVLKGIHDWIRLRQDGLVTRYVEITGRIMALVTGTIAVEMILNGIELWLDSIA